MICISVIPADAAADIGRSYCGSAQDVSVIRTLRNPTLVIRCCDSCRESACRLNHTGIITLRYSTLVLSDNTGHILTARDIAGVQAVCDRTACFIHSGDARNCISGCHGYIGRNLFDHSCVHADQCRGIIALLQKAADLQIADASDIICKKTFSIFEIQILDLLTGAIKSSCISCPCTAAANRLPFLIVQIDICSQNGVDIMLVCYSVREPFQLRGRSDLINTFAISIRLRNSLTVPAVRITVRFIVFCSFACLPSQNRITPIEILLVLSKRFAKLCGKVLKLFFSLGSGSAGLNGTAIQLPDDCFCNSSFVKYFYQGFCTIGKIQIAYNCSLCSFLYFLNFARRIRVFNTSRSHSAKKSSRDLICGNRSSII